MREVTEVYTVYTYDELSEDQQEKAIERYYDINVRDGWWEGDYHLGLSSQEMKDRRFKEGEFPAHSGLFSYEEIYFDLGRGRYIQFIDLEVNSDNAFRKFLRIPKRLWEHCNWQFNESPRYGCNDSTTEFEIESDFWDGRDFTQTQEAIVDRACGIMTDKIAEALSDLQETYEHLTSREAIEETLKTNEYTFTEDAKIA